MPSCGIVGAGLVGCLTALALEQRGWDVTLFDLRLDPRVDNVTSSKQPDRRSINLAISNRGIAALNFVDKEVSRRILQDAIPMKGRMIHPVQGELSSQAYGLNGECINSIDRAVLNNSMLNEAENKQITICWNHQLTNVDFKRGNLSFKRKFDHNKSDLASPEPKLDYCFDVIVGADGAFSKVREQMMRVLSMDFRQTYIPQTYVELYIPPGPNGTPLLDPNHLHIWPRGDYMLIALPNKDMSFTSTLFAPEAIMDKLQEHEAIVDFFKREFPDSLSLIGEESLIRNMKGTPRWPLLTVECSPYHYKDRAIILGDASHCMVPFYGQGMNCGFEDVRQLMQIIDTSSSLSEAFQRYTTTRKSSLSAICKMALQNYDEMASGVVSRFYLLRKRLDGILARCLGGKWLPLYTMVTFKEDISYEEAWNREQRQKKILENSIRLSGVLGIGGVAMLGLLQARSLWMK